MDTNMENNGFIWVILIIAIFFGGGFGFGGNNWQRSSVQDNYVLSSDFANLSRQLDNGFNGVERGIDTIRTGICELGYANLQQTNGLNMAIMQGNYETSRQLSDCCCQNREAIANLRFDGATQTRDIIDAGNANTRAILEAMCNDKIERLTSENNALKLAISQNAQNAYLISQLKG